MIRPLHIEKALTCQKDNTRPNEQGTLWGDRPAPWTLTGLRLGSVWLVCSLLIFLGATLPVAEAQVRPTTLKDMVRRAATIVTGRVVDTREGHHPDYPHVVVTFVTVEVQEMLKGQANHLDRHVFMQFGGRRAMRMLDLPTYRPGEEVVLFLYPTSRYGFTSPVGGHQGKFYLRVQPQTGQRVVMNALNNARLFEGIKTETLSSAERRMVQSPGGAVDYRAFASLVRKLAKD